MRDTEGSMRSLVAPAIFLLSVQGIGCGGGGAVEVQIGTVERRDLVQIVTASGEITPATYVNVGAEQMGRITEILVQEGDAVEKGQVLARLETVQPSADVDAQKSGLELLRAEARAAEAAIPTNEATQRAQKAALERAEAERDQADVLYERAASLVEEGLIAKEEFDRRRASLRTARALVEEAEANLARLQAERQELMARRDSATQRVEQAEAQLRRVRDVLRRYTTISPIAGIVTNLPVRVGETVVPGIQNSPSSLIVTIADMSVITAEVLADETDVVNVATGQPAEISVDALPDRPLTAHVTEIGNSAILRSSGLTAAQSTASTQEARDFKVTAAIENPPESLRPGMSCTARITTATRRNALTIPIQALTVRAGEEPGRDQEGVFVVEGETASFRPIETGISGGGSIEIVSGLSENDQLVIGGYQALRSLQSGDKIRAAKRN
ncbi:MAG: efflux RND transporter periplasmic adaptor subunit [Acidobacteria bacterium]|nr:efflux RND transporter periplasmic adaptor subunit [Acidobacteriota bacterium]